jgi:hypothetical protein
MGQGFLFFVLGCIFFILTKKDFRLLVCGLRSNHLREKLYKKFRNQGFSKIELAYRMIIEPIVKRK